jgi:hypothetical protein
VVAVADPVWIVVPAVAVAATLISLPSVEPLSEILLNVAIYVPFLCE